MPKWINLYNVAWFMGGTVFITLFSNLTTLPIWIGFLIYFGAYEISNRSFRRRKRNDDHDAPEQD
jgi:hypothetical protein